MHLRTQAVSAYAFSCRPGSRQWTRPLHPCYRVTCYRVFSLSGCQPGNYACYRVFATEPDHYACYAADRSHSNLGGNLVVVLSLRSGHATQQAYKSGGTLATTQSIHDSAERLQILIKDDHLCCRVLLQQCSNHLCSFVRNDNNGKQRSVVCFPRRTKTIDLHNCFPTK